ncbi:SIMPL domain-containing protein [Candidatus Uhrbacteria bacterium]|nr:SIMPL domain-containing protein [Candidatus Uhrbacteria bacterium]
MIKKLLGKNSNGGHGCWSYDSHLQIFCVLLLVSLFFVFGTLSAYLFEKTRSITRMERANQTVTMTGEGIINAKPTIAVMQAGLETAAKTVQEAVNENTKKMNGFLAQLPSFGIEEKDRKTISYSIQPKYEYPENERGFPSSPVLVGYTVFNTVQLKVRNLEKVGDVLGSIGTAGLNQVGSFSFNIDDLAILKTQAMEAALANAQEKVTRFANMTGSRIGSIVSFYESTEGFPPMPSPMPMMSIKGREAALAPSVEAGEQEVKAVVNVTYKILR